MQCISILQLPAFKGLISLLFLLAFCACDTHTTYRSSVPSYPVNIRINTYEGTYVHFVPENSYTYMIVDKDGTILSEQRSCIKTETFNFSFPGSDNYIPEDSFAAQNNSPWGIFFRVDDDLLSPSGGEVWIGTDTVGVSNYTTDGNYWLEKKIGNDWKRLGGDDTQASWGEETIQIVSQTAMRQVDWSSVYGKLDAGVYRMGKRFYNGTESIIQYAEFAIYQTGGIFGEGGEEALARVDAAIEKI